MQRHSERGRKKKKESHKPSLGGREAEVFWERGNISRLRNKVYRGGNRKVSVERLGAK